MKARLVDIAKAAHVSEATVSRVLAGRPGVNAETRDRVIAEARKLGRSLEGSLHTGAPLVGIVMPTMDNPVFPAMLERLEAEAFASGVETLVSINARDEEQEAASMERLVHAGAHGLIVVSGQHAHDSTNIEHYRSFAARGIRLCLINGVREGIEASFISTDDSAAVKLALGHLRDLGHERVGLAVGDEHSFPVRGKVEAFEELWPHETACVAYTDFSVAGGYQAALQLHDQGCTAMVCGSDQMAMGAISAIRAMGLSVPGDMSIVGYDDIPSAAIHYPSITTIRQPILHIAKAAIRAAGVPGAAGRQASRSEFSARPELVVRESTAPPRAAA